MDTIATTDYADFAYEMTLGRSQAAERDRLAPALPETLTINVTITDNCRATPATSSNSMRAAALPYRFR